MLTAIVVIAVALGAWLVASAASPRTRASRGLKFPILRSDKVSLGSFILLLLGHPPSTPTPPPAASDKDLDVNWRWSQEAQEYYPIS